MDQVPPPLLICLDENWDTKGSYRPVCSPHPGAGSGKKTVPLNSASVRVEYNKNIAVIFWGTGRGIEDYDKQ